jgi:NADP-dependent 3-hydroxy acid dehydrogenase YdfG
MSSDLPVGVITGATSGIGKAIALALAAEANVKLCVCGRNVEQLQRLARQLCEKQIETLSCPVDLESAESIEHFVQTVESTFGRADYLVHSAGVITQAVIEQGTMEDFDRHYAVNVRAPYLLTKRLLPMLKKSQGQAVFINSTAGLAAASRIGQYAASKHALKAIADSLRDEVNADGVRVLSIFLGRTATPMQASVFAAEGREYHPELLMQPEDVASVVVNALKLPRTAEITEIKMRPLRKSY